MGLACCKAYDIRGRVPDELDEDLARAIGRAYAERFHPRRVVVGRDMRLSSPAIAGGCRSSPNSARARHSPWRCRSPSSR